MGDAPNRGRRGNVSAGAYLSECWHDVYSAGRGKWCYLCKNGSWELLAGADSPIRRVAELLKATPSQVALAWLLARSPVVLPIPGTSSVAHLEENVAAAGLKIDENKMQELAHAAHG
jgi:aryl-alcohol dehydrogenase-like predicted oxidoreductase